MSFRINTNTQAARSLASLSSTTNEIGQRQLRLATGSRLNSAADDSAGYTISTKLNSKTRGQAQALSNIGDAKNMLTVGEGALGSVQDILLTMKEKAVQAANDTLGTAERSAIETQMDALYNEIGDILGGATFNGQDLFAGDTLNFQVGDTSTDTFAYTSASLGKDDVVGGISSDGRAASVGTAVNTGEGQYTTYGGNVTVADNSYTGSHSGDLYFKIDGTDLQVSTENTAAGFDSPLQTVDLSAYTAGGDITVQGMTIQLDEATAALGDGEGFKIGVEAAIAAGTDTFVGTLTDATAAQGVIAQIDAGVSVVAEQMSKLGDVQNRLDFKAQNLETSKTNYEAANSRIQDADFAKEQMEIVKLQILQQTGSAMFAQANASGQSVLSFF